MFTIKQEHGWISGVRISNFKGCNLSIFKELRPSQQSKYIKEEDNIERAHFVFV